MMPSNYDYTTYSLPNTSPPFQTSSFPNKLLHEESYKLFENNLFTLISSISEIPYEKFNKEKPLLEYFYFKEQSCFKLIHSLNDYNKEKLFNSITYEELTRLFYKSPLGKDIKQKLSKIEITKLNSTRNFNTYLYSIFETELIPKFLICDYIKQININEFIECYDYIQNNNILCNNQHTFLYDLIRKYYESFYSLTITPFHLYLNKETYFNIFILCNYTNFQKSQMFINILKRNFNYITTYFNMNIQLITFEYIYFTYINIPNDKHSSLLQHNINILINEINDNQYILIYILTSYYYFIKHDLIPLNFNSIHYDNPRYMNLFHSIKETFISTFHNTISFNIKILFAYLDSYYLTKHPFLYIPPSSYTITTIDNIIMNSKCHSLINKYIHIKQHLGQLNIYYGSTSQQSNINNSITTPNDMHSSINQNIINALSPVETFFHKIRISPYIYNTPSISISILISGFLSEGDETKHNKLWRHFMNDNMKYTMFYFYHWPAETKQNFISYPFNNKKNPFTSLPLFFRKSKAISKDIGKLLGIILYSKLFFKRCSINLIAFSLGCNVIKYCIKMLYELGGFDIVNNVVLMGGATNMKNKQKWEKILEMVVAGKIYNCYSKYDSVLKWLYQNFVKDDPIGLKPLELGKGDLIINKDFSNMKIGHLEYRKRFREFVNLFDLN